MATPTAIDCPSRLLQPSHLEHRSRKELGKIPFFVRGKARRTPNGLPKTWGVATITVETLYDAKAHFSR